MTKKRQTVLEQWFRTWQENHGFGQLWYTQDHCESHVNLSLPFVIAICHCSDPVASHSSSPTKTGLNPDLGSSFIVTGITGKSGFANSPPSYEYPDHFLNGDTLQTEMPTSGVCILLPNGFWYALWSPTMDFQREVLSFFWSVFVLLCLTFLGWAKKSRSRIPGEPSLWIRRAKKKYVLQLKSVRALKCYS